MIQEISELNARIVAEVATIIPAEMVTTIKLIPEEFISEDSINEITIIFDDIKKPSIDSIDDFYVKQIREHLIKNVNKLIEKYKGKQLVFFRIPSIQFIPFPNVETEKNNIIITSVFGSTWPWVDKHDLGVFGKFAVV